MAVLEVMLIFHYEFEKRSFEFHYLSNNVIILRESKRVAAGLWRPLLDVVVRGVILNMSHVPAFVTAFQHSRGDH